MQPVFPAYLIARLLLVLVLLAGMYFLRSFMVPALAALIAAGLRGNDPAAVATRVREMRAQFTGVHFIRG